MEGFLIQQIKNVMRFIGWKLKLEKPKLEIRCIF